MKIKKLAFRILAVIMIALCLSTQALAYSVPASYAVKALPRTIRTSDALYYYFDFGTGNGYHVYTGDYSTKSGSSGEILLQMTSDDGALAEFGCIARLSSRTGTAYTRATTFTETNSHDIRTLSYTSTGTTLEEGSPVYASGKRNIRDSEGNGEDFFTVAGYFCG